MDIQTKTPLPDINKLWNYTDPAATEQRFRELLPEAIAQGNVNYQGELLTQIARTYSLRKMFAEAHDTLNQVEGLPLQQYPLVHVRYLLERGRAYNSANERYRAKELFLKAWEMAKREELDYYAVDAAHMLAIAEHNPTVQLQWNEAAIRYAETAIDPSAMQWLGSLYNNTGWTYHDMGNFAKALNIFERALVFRTVHQHSLKTILIAKWCVARAHRSLGNVDEALRLQTRLKEEYERNQLPQDGYVYEELALLHDLKGDKPAAKESATVAHGLLSTDNYFRENEQERLEVIKNLSL